ncbi:MAG: L-lactate dehydrogenase [bacterium]|nr:L-lactate dehydrogenase [bacterium]
MKAQCVCPSQKIAIIGAGAVGSTTAYTIMLRNLASEVILIDINTQKEIGEVMDIDEGLCFVETGCVRAGDYHSASDADIIIITAGLAQKPGETRMDLVNKNREIIKSIFKSIGKIKSTTIVMMVSNPVDIMTHVAQEVSGLPLNQVFGTGTALDTARLHTDIGHKLGIYAQNVDGYVMGEHGNSEFIAWSTVSVGGVAVKDLGISTKEEEILEGIVRNAAYEIINRKGATFYGIAVTVADIVEAILFNQHKILPLSVRVENYLGVSDICIGVPAVLGRNGIEKVWPLELTSEEKKKFQKSAKIIKEHL